MKPAICERCGKPTGGMVPDDATDVTCFACDSGVHPSHRMTGLVCANCGAILGRLSERELEAPCRHAMKPEPE